jgi:hypothetical protein
MECFRTVLQLDDDPACTAADASSTAAAAAAAADDLPLACCIAAVGGRCLLRTIGSSAESSQMLATRNMCDSSYCQAQAEASLQVLPSACGRAWLRAPTPFPGWAGTTPPAAGCSSECFTSVAVCTLCCFGSGRAADHSTVAAAPAACHLALACQWLTSTPPILCPCRPIQTPCAKADHQEAKRGDTSRLRWHQLSTQPRKLLLSRVVGEHLGVMGALQGAAGPREVDLQRDDSAARILAAAGSGSCACKQMCAPRQLLLAQGQRALHKAAAAAAVSVE